MSSAGIDYIGMLIDVVAVVPASTVRVAPVIQRAWLLARNTTAQAQSQPLPSVPKRLLACRAALASSLMPPEYIMGV